MLPVLVLASCSEGVESPVGIGPESTYGGKEIVAHEKMELGPGLSNPYSVANVSLAVSRLYPTRTETKVPVTHLYVRFLPKNVEEYSLLDEAGVDMFDHPLDRRILKDGDYYHDPEIPEDQITWQYAVVPEDFSFPAGIRREILEECFIPSDDGVATKGFEDLDWDAVERRCFEESGNGDLLLPSTRAKVKPSGRIAIKDNGLNKYVGVAGVKMMANVFVKVSSTFTDEKGDYSFSSKFSSKPRYSICFKNVKGFSIGLNLVIVPASTSTLGKDDPNGIDVRIDSNSDETLFRRCAVNNAAYDYYAYCENNGITSPAQNIRLWILGIVKPSSALMLHHGAILDNMLVGDFLGVYKLIVQAAAPDITIGAKNRKGNYKELYMSTIHEMAHATHFAKVGTAYWSKYITYILSSFLTSGKLYGSGNGDDAGYCEVGEMWGFFIERSVHRERYKSASTQGSDQWFHPQVFEELEQGGVSKGEICFALKSGVIDMKSLEEELLIVCPSKKSLISKVFRKYSR